MANVLRHERFDRPPVVLPKRRGRLPQGVVTIKSADRLRVGVRAEIVGAHDKKENDGIRVLIEHFDPRTRHCWLTKSLGRAIRCSDGELAKEVWFKPQQLRRVWTGLSENERIQLRMREGAMRKTTDAAKRATRTRRLKAMIATAINQARHETWEKLFRTCAVENPEGTLGAFNRWFNEAWTKALKAGAP